MNIREKQIIDFNDESGYRRVPFFTIDWENVLALTKYHTNQTAILKTTGEKLVLNQPLRETLQKFALDHGIFHYEMQALYGMVNERTLGYIAGPHQLIPSCGAGNDRVVYCMAHHLQEAHRCPNGVILEFVVSNRTHYLVVDTSYCTFRRMMTAGDQVTNLQVSVLNWLLHDYGIEKFPNRERTYYALNNWWQTYRNVQAVRCKALISQSFKRVYGEEVDPDLLAAIDRLMKK